MLLDKKQFPGDYTLIDDLDNTGADLVLAGHYHLGFGALQRGNRYFINPGALVRLSNHHREIERKVKVALIDLTGGAVNCRLITSQSAPVGRRSWTEPEPRSLNPAYWLWRDLPGRLKRLPSCDAGM